MSTLLPIAVSTRRMPAVTATAGQVQFPFTFPIVRPGDVRVRRTRGNVEAELAYGSDYTVWGVNEPAGGTVTLTAGSLAGDLIVVEGDAALDRLSSVAVNGRFSSRQIDQEFNLSLMRDQELRRDLDTLAAPGGGGGGTVPAHNHTSAEITDFGEAAQDAVAGALVAGANVTITYNDAANTITIASTGGGGRSVKDFGAVGDGATNDWAAFEAALTAAAGGDVIVPWTVNGYRLNAPITVGRGLNLANTRASRLRGESYVRLSFVGLTNSQDAVTLAWDEHGGVEGVTIDMNNAYTSAAVYTGRDGLRVSGGNWPRLDVRVLNAGRDGVHFEPSANFEWLENLTAPHIEVINCGRDAFHFNNANLTDCFMNELVFVHAEARHWKRNGVRAVCNHPAFGLTGVKWLHVNLDARRAVANMDSQDVVYFQAGSGTGVQFNAWEFLGGAWENVINAHPTGYGINADAGVQWTNGFRLENVFTYNIGTSFNAQDQLINPARLTGEDYWIETLNGGGSTALGGRVSLPGNPCAIATLSITNATGAGVAVQLTSGVTELVDRASWFSNGVFTAPCAGIYEFHCSLLLTGLTSAHTFAVLYFELNTGTFHNVEMKNPWASANASQQCTIQGSVILQLARGDTVRTGLQVTGGTQVVSVNAVSRLSGRLIA